MLKKMIKEILREVMESHAYPESDNHLDCGNHPCAWCREAKIILDTIDDVPCALCGGTTGY